MERAAELGYDAVALVDRDGLSGAPRFFKAAKAARDPADRRRRAEPRRGRCPAAPGRDAAGLPEPVPAGHADEGRRAEGRGPAPLRDAGGPRGRARARCRGSRRSSLRVGAARHRPPGADRRGFRAGPRLPRRAAPPAPRAGSRQPGAPRPGRRARACRPWPRTACATRPRRAGRSWTCSPASARSARSRTPGACSRATPSATSSRRRRWRRSSPTASDLLRNAEALAERLRSRSQDLGYRFPDYPVPAGETQFSFLRQVDRRRARASATGRTTRRRAARSSTSSR